MRTNELSIANVNLNSTLEKLYVNYRATLRALAAALEARDVETKGHSDRVVGYCLKLGKEIGLRDRELKHSNTERCCTTIGKIGVPDSISAQTRVRLPKKNGLYASPRGLRRPDSTGDRFS